MLNVMVAENNTNDQFTTLVDPDRYLYKTSSEMTIEFEVDGPYKAMVLPASKEEGKLIKKRYAVFNFDGSLAELKGFELKRRGELKLIKVFQGEVFDQFLLGKNLVECYGAVAAVANRWLDMLDTHGVDLTDEELVDHISEQCVMSKGLDAYEGRKSCAVTCATRLAQFLGDERVKDKGLVCHYVIAAHPKGTPTSERAIPVAIFSTEPSVARTYLRRWCGGDVSKGNTNGMPDVRDILDWDYYRERLGSAIQKIITIPAAMQRVPNPVPRVVHPDWLHKKVTEKEDKHKQAKVDTLFAAARGKSKAMGPVVPDLEDLGGPIHAPLAAGTGTTVGVACAVDISPNGNEDVDMENEEPNPQPGGAGELPSTRRAIPEELESRAPVPPRHETFHGWLKAKKEMWRRSRGERKRRRENTGAEERRQRMRAAAGVDGIFAQQAEAAASAPWQIVSLSATPEPGMYKAWSVINGRMHAIPVRIPRTFFVDATLPPEHQTVAGLGQLVRRTLPSGAAPHYTYQVTMSEKVYRDDLAVLEAKLSQPGVLGVYEAQVPPEWSAALSTGCVAVLAPSARRRNLGAGFDVTELQARPVVQYGYFSSPGSLKHMALHHSQDPARGRALYALHLPADSTCHMWIVNPARGGQREVTSAVMERAWGEMHEVLTAELDAEVELEEVPRCEVAYVRTPEAAVKAMQKLLARVK